MEILKNMQQDIEKELKILQKKYKHELKSPINTKIYKKIIKSLQLFKKYTLPNIQHSQSIQNSIWSIQVVQFIENILNSICLTNQETQKDLSQVIIQKIAIIEYKQSQLIILMKIYSFIMDFFIRLTLKKGSKNIPYQYYVKVIKEVSKIQILFCKLHQIQNQLVLNIINQASKKSITPNYTNYIKLKQWKVQMMQFVAKSYQIFSSNQQKQAILSYQQSKVQFLIMCLRLIVQKIPSRQKLLVSKPSRVQQTKILVQNKSFTNYNVKSEQMNITIQSKQNCKSIDQQASNKKDNKKTSQRQHKTLLSSISGLLSNKNKTQQSNKESNQINDKNKLKADKQSQQNLLSLDQTKIIQFYLHLIVNEYQIDSSQKIIHNLISTYIFSNIEPQILKHLQKYINMILFPESKNQLSLLTYSTIIIKFYSQSLIIVNKTQQNLQSQQNKIPRRQNLLAFITFIIQYYEKNLIKHQEYLINYQQNHINYNENNINYKENHIDYKENLRTITNQDGNIEDLQTKNLKQMNQTIICLLSQVISLKVIKRQSNNSSQKFKLQIQNLNQVNTQLTIHQIILNQHNFQTLSTYQNKQKILNFVISQTKQSYTYIHSNSFKNLIIKKMQISSDQYINFFNSYENILIDGFYDMYQDLNAQFTRHQFNQLSHIYNTFTYMKKILLIIYSHNSQYANQNIDKNYIKNFQAKSIKIIKCIHKYIILLFQNVFYFQRLNHLDNNVLSNTQLSSKYCIQFMKIAYCLCIPENQSQFQYRNLKATLYLQKIIDYMMKPQIKTQNLHKQILKIVMNIVQKIVYILQKQSYYQLSTQRVKFQQKQSLNQKILNKFEDFLINANNMNNNANNMNNNVIHQVILQGLLNNYTFLKEKLDTHSHGQTLKYGLGQEKYLLTIINKIINKLNDSFANNQQININPKYFQRLLSIIQIYTCLNFQPNEMCFESKYLSQTNKIQTQLQQIISLSKQIHAEMIKFLFFHNLIKQKCGQFQLMLINQMVALKLSLVALKYNDLNFIHKLYSIFEVWQQSVKRTKKDEQSLTKLRQIGQFMVLFVWNTYSQKSNRSYYSNIICNFLNSQGIKILSIESIRIILKLKQTVLSKIFNILSQSIILQKYLIQEIKQTQEKQIGNILSDILNETNRWIGRQNHRRQNWYQLMKIILSQFISTRMILNLLRLKSMNTSKQCNKTIIQILGIFDKLLINFFDKLSQIQVSSNNPSLTKNHPQTPSFKLSTFNQRQQLIKNFKTNLFEVQDQIQLDYQLETYNQRRIINLDGIQTDLTIEYNRTQIVSELEIQLSPGRSVWQDQQPIKEEQDFVEQGLQQHNQMCKDDLPLQLIQIFTQIYTKILQSENLPIDIIHKIHSTLSIISKTFVNKLMYISLEVSTIFFSLVAQFIQLTSYERINTQVIIGENKVLDVLLYFQNLTLNITNQQELTKVHKLIGFVHIYIKVCSENRVFSEQRVCNQQEQSLSQCYQTCTNIISKIYLTINKQQSTSQIQVQQVTTLIVSNAIQEVLAQSYNQIANILKSLSDQLILIEQKGISRQESKISFDFFTESLQIVCKFLSSKSCSNIKDILSQLQQIFDLMRQIPNKQIIQSIYQVSYFNICYDTLIDLITYPQHNEVLTRILKNNRPNILNKYNIFKQNLIYTKNEQQNIGRQVNPKSNRKIKQMELVKNEDNQVSLSPCSPITSHIKLQKYQRKPFGNTMNRQNGSAK